MTKLAIRPVRLESTNCDLSLIARMTTGVVNAVMDHLFNEEEGNIFGVLDGACIPELRDVLHDLNPDYYCLYRGDLEPDMAEVAPYLVSLEPEDEFTSWLIERGWGNDWGIFVLSPADLRTMRKHFRKLLTVYDPNGNPMLFRYYDPRVLRKYLPTCNAEELATIFGPINSYFLEDEDPLFMLRCSSPSGALTQERFQLR